VYKKIMVPVDLAHADRLEKALRTAADLSRHYAAPVCYVGISAETPGPVAHNPEEYAARLKDFARAQAEAHGIEVATHPIASHDPAIDLDRQLLDAADAVGADLIVAGSHVPGLLDRIWPSHGGSLAAHATISVFVVR